MALFLIPVILRKDMVSSNAVNENSKSSFCPHHLCSYFSRISKCCSVKP